MSLLSMMEAKLPPGFRFHPRDDELVCDYLANKISASGGVISSSSSFFGERSPMINVDLNKCEPWDLPELACIGGGGGGGGKVEWYLFSLRDRKYSSGERRNRATASGYWKATGKDRHIKRKGLLVGMRKTLVFYQGRAPKGSKTHWVMHEFRTIQPPPPPHYYSIPIPTIKHKQQQQHAMEEDWVLCRIFYKSSKSRRADMISSKPPMGPSMHHHHHQTSYEDHTTCSSLPPVLVPPAMPMTTSLSVDKYIISTFSGSAGTDQPPPAPLMSLKLQGPTYDRELQVLPCCFSTNANFPAAAAGYMSSTEAPLPTPTNSQLAAAQHYFGSCSLLPPDHFGLNQLHYLDCDNKLVMIRPVLNH